jgi:hypothetical protein
MCRLFEAVLVIVFGTAVVACGGSESDAEQIEEVSKDLAAAVRDKDWPEACDLLSTKAKAQLEVAGALLGGGDCPEIIDKAVALGDGERSSPDPDRIRVAEIKIKNDRATARVTPSTDGDPLTRYVKEDGDWKIDADLDQSSSSTGNAGDEAQGLAAPKLQVPERGFTNTDGGVSFGLILSNPSQNTDASNVDVQVNLIGARGDVLATAPSNIIGVPAGEQFVIGGEADTKGDRVDRLEVTVTAEAGSKAGTIALPEVAGAKLSRDEFGLSVRVEVRNTLDEPLSSISDVFAVLRGADGKIVGGVSGFPAGDIQPGGRASVELSSFEPVPGAVRAEAGADGETSG